MPLFRGVLNSFDGGEYIGMGKVEREGKGREDTVAISTELFFAYKILFLNKTLPWEL